MASVLTDWPRGEIDDNQAVLHNGHTDWGPSNLPAAEPGSRSDSVQNRRSQREEPYSSKSLFLTHASAGLSSGHGPDQWQQEEVQASMIARKTPSTTGGATVHELERPYTNGFYGNKSQTGDATAESESQDSGHKEAEVGRGDCKERVLKLSPAKIYELTSSPKSLPILNSWDDHSDKFTEDNSSNPKIRERTLTSIPVGAPADNDVDEREERDHSSAFASSSPSGTTGERQSVYEGNNFDHASEPHASGRAASTPLAKRQLSGSRSSTAGKSHALSSPKLLKVTPPPLRFESSKAGNRPSVSTDSHPSPMPQSIPVPPLSIPTYLQLELSTQRPSPLYIHRSMTSDFPYESSRVKIERLLNFLLLPPQLEQVLWFGALACLDAWLFSFTILPLRFLKAVSILCHSWGRNIAKEAKFIGNFIYKGMGRMWRRRRRWRIDRTAYVTRNLNVSSVSSNSENPVSSPIPADKTFGDVEFVQAGRQQRRRLSSDQKHRRSKSTPSALSPDHKADLLKGLLILLSCGILMYFDASRMYHGIRGQAAIKLYVIYNVLEVCDRLFSALGQDVLECLFSKETLERKPDGRSKVWRPFWLFLLALCYNLVHATALFYQVITLNVAVNSYSNALLTLLMSNQFVEIKSTVFKKFEKENLFQLTCADVVERFQLWLMLMIIASRNIIETGGLNVGSSVIQKSTASSSGSSSILPRSFTLFAPWTGQVMGPFFLVLGSEMLVDWLKHAYITKFNNTKPAIYGRFLDVLAKDYYSNAFADQNLTKRLGLPVVPLACLFIRASVQTYHMFLATHMPMPLPSTATSLSVENATTSPGTTAAIEHVDHIFRRALGRSSFGAGHSPAASLDWTTDDIIAILTMTITFLVIFFALLALKLVLGMCLLSFARRRYKGMKEREGMSVHAEGKRVGGWGVVEVDADKRRWIYQDDYEGWKKMSSREREGKEKGETGTFGGIERYSMVGKRIW